MMSIKIEERGGAGKLDNVEIYLNNPIFPSIYFWKQGRGEDLLGSIQRLDLANKLHLWRTHSYFYSYLQGLVNSIQYFLDYITTLNPHISKFLPADPSTCSGSACQLVGQPAEVNVATVAL